MMKYLQLKNGKYLAENVICAIGIDDGEIYVDYIDGHTVLRAAAESAEPCTIESVVVALRAKLAEQRE